MMRHDEPSTITIGMQNKSREQLQTLHLHISSAVIVACGRVLQRVKDGFAKSIHGAIVGHSLMMEKRWRDPEAN